MERRQIRAAFEFAFSIPGEVVRGVGQAALREIDILLGGDAPRKELPSAPVRPPTPPEFLEPPTEEFTVQARTGKVEQFHPQIRGH